MIDKAFIIAFRQIHRRRLRALLTGLAFAMATLIYTLLAAIPASMDRIAEGASKGLRLIVTAPNAYQLPARYCDAIKQMNHVLGCAPEIIWSGVYRDPRDVIVAYGITPDIVTVTADSDYRAPRKLQEEVFADRRSASIGGVLMREHDWRLGRLLTLRSPDNSGIALTFIPRIEFPSTAYLSRVFYFDRRLLDEAVKSSFGIDIADRASFLVVRVDRAPNLGLVAEEIDETFRNSDAETQTITESDAVANNITAIGDLRTIIAALCTIVLVTLLSIAGTSMAIMVRDRIGEMAVMRALGFSRGNVGTIVLMEALMIGVAGATAGGMTALCIFGRGFTVGTLTGSLGYIEVDWSVALMSVAMATMVAVISVVGSLFGALRIPPALAFRKVV